MIEQIKDVEFTSREEDVLQSLTEYLTNDEMCSKLHMGYETLRSHLKNIKRKLHMRHRIHLIKYAIEHGYGKQQEVSA